MFDRIYVDTIENLVSIVECLASSTFNARVCDAQAVLKNKGKVFQRLEDMAELFQTHVGSDLRGTVGPPLWSLLESTWAARHVFTHRDGIVDDRYLATVPTATLSVGERLTVSGASVRQAFDATTRLCEAITASASEGSRDNLGFPPSHAGLLNAELPDELSLGQADAFPQLHGFLHHMRHNHDL
ncbi:MAG: hypothetical protein ABSG36_18315 [Acidimicrobiales bacterium]